MSLAKRFDVVVFGATGFTGALVARYLLQSPEQGLTWAIAGRNATKLETVKQQLKEKLPRVSPSEIDAVPVLVADSGDETQLRALVQKTKVVLSTVGPYKLYGELLVKLCAETGARYCDLTGEISWVRDMITKYEAVAAQSSAILINCCGVEAVPSDLTTFVLADAVRKATNAAPSAVTLAFTHMDLAASGGTLASAFHLIETSSIMDLVNMANPFVLVDEATRAKYRASGLEKRNDLAILPQNDKALGRWTSFFPLAAGNQAIVHRSNYLQRNAYGEQFVYKERSAFGSLWNQLTALFTMMLSGPFIFFCLTRAIAKKFVPQPGEGPPEALVANGRLVASAVAYANNGKLCKRATIVGTGDPCYGMTSKVIAECAICLARDELTRADLSGGFHTTASALGHRLVKRLHDKKILTIDVHPAETSS